jgi:hypothetical protein
MFGGVKFELSAKATLTPEESALISKYKVDKEVLLKKEIKIPLTGRSLLLDITIGSLVGGQNFKCNDIGEILEYEANIRESCQKFRDYLTVMQSFGGEEVVEYK